MSLTPREGLLLHTDDIFDFAEDASSVILKTRNQIIADDFSQNLKSHTAKAVSERIRSNIGRSDANTLDFGVDVNVDDLFNETIHGLGMTHTSKDLNPVELGMSAAVLKNLGISIRKPYRKDAGYYLVYPSTRSNIFYNNLLKMNNIFMWGYDGVSGEALFETKEESQEPIEELVQAASLPDTDTLHELTQQVVNDWQYASSDAAYHMTIHRFNTSDLSLGEKEYRDISEESKNFASNLSIAKWSLLILIQDVLAPVGDTGRGLDNVMHTASEAMMFIGETEDAKINETIRLSNVPEILSRIGEVSNEPHQSISVTVDMSALESLVTEFQQYMS